jgi:hypothetical protein
MAKELNLDVPGEWAGLWWLPDDPDERVPGVLRYDPETGLELSLIGAFEDRITSHPSPGTLLVHEGRRTWDVIQGAAEQREITLLDCFPRKGKRTFGARVKSPDKQTVAATTAVNPTPRDSSSRKPSAPACWVNQLQNTIRSVSTVRSTPSIQVRKLWWRVRPVDSDRGPARCAMRVKSSRSGRFSPPRRYLSPRAPFSYASAWPRATSRTSTIFRPVPAR